MCICVYVIRVYLYMCMLVYVYMRICVYVDTCIRVYVYTCICVYLYTYICVYVYPTRILVDNIDIISPFITEMYNESNRKSNFPNSLKLADVTPAHKKDERIIKGNYRNVKCEM